MNTSSNNEAKVALVTGASRRLGRATSIMLHDNGYNIAIHYNHSANEAQKLCETLNHKRPGSASTHSADLSDQENMTGLVSSVTNKWTRLDLLVNNASTFYPTPVGSVTLEQWDDLMASNAKAPFFLSQAAKPHLEKSAGCIINMIDVHAQAPLAEHPVYCMAKAALAMMTRSLAVELAPSIRVNGISPGAILWPENDPGFSEAKWEKVIEGVPLQRAGSEQDIAETVLFLAKSEYITGQIVAVDGGRSLNPG